MKIKALLIILLLVACLLVGCGDNSQSGLKVGPTVTPMPEKATEDDAGYIFEYTDEEVEEVLARVLENVKALSKDYNFEITDDMVCEELTEHADKSSEVYVYDKQDNMLAVLMYDSSKHLYRAFVNEYENNKQINGCEYIEGELVRYYETADGTGKFHVEAEIEEDGGYKLSYTTEDGVQYREFSAE